MMYLILSNIKVNGINPIYLIVLITFAVSCKKDKVENNDGCTPLEKCSQFTQGGSYKITNSESCRFTFPSFNPNDENEILFVQSCIGDTTLANIYKYNLTDNSSTLIYSGDLWSKPRWGSNGWIIFSANYLVFRIKDDGSELTQISNEGCYHYPQWYFESDSFAVYNQCLKADVLFDFDGNTLDTLPKIIGGNSNFSKQPYLIGNGSLSGGVSFYNFELDSFEYRYDYSPFIDSKEYMSARAGSVFWKNNKEVIYSNFNGLNQLKIPSLNNEVFKKGCVTRFYSSGDINSSKSKMVWSIIDYTQVDECNLTFKQAIYIMNVDGSNEEKIDLN